MRTCGECVKHGECFTSSKHKACSDFVSKGILPKELEEKFPTQGKASSLRFGRTNKSQFTRDHRERNK